MKQAKNNDDYNLTILNTINIAENGIEVDNFMQDELGTFIKVEKKR